MRRATDIQVAEALETLPAYKLPTVTEAAYYVTSTVAWEIGAATLRASDAIAQLASRVAYGAYEYLFGEVVEPELSQTVQEDWNW